MRGPVFRILFLAPWLQLAVCGADTPNDVHRLDPFIVKGEPVPLFKIELGYHLRTARYGAAAVADGDYLYIIGGCNTYGVALADVERFDLRTGTSEPFAQLATPRRGHRAILLRGKIYVLGGFDSSAWRSIGIFESSVEVVDLATRSAIPAAPMPVPKAHFACAESGGKIYVIGGARQRGGNIVTTNTAETYDVATGAWTSGVPMPTPRMAMATNVLGFIVVPGGYRTGREVDDVEAYNPRRRTWVVLPKLHKTISANSLVFLDHYLFLFGSQELIAYDLKTKRSESYRFDYKPARETTALIHRGRIYVIGGNQDTEADMGPTFKSELRPANSSPFLSPAEAQDRNPFPVADSSVGFGGIRDHAALDDIQVYELRSVMPATPSPAR